MDDYFITGSSEKYALFLKKMRYPFILISSVVAVYFIWGVPALRLEYSGRPEHTTWARCVMLTGEPFEVYHPVPVVFFVKNPKFKQD
jgi:hypothetical protein